MVSIRLPFAADPELRGWAWPPLPLSPKLLERYRLASRRKLRPDLLGGHLVRRRGQSLEFREYEHYLPGDDIRHVDWRASARYGRPEDLLSRSYVAEEQMTVALSLDFRETLLLPEALPKRQIAVWLAEAIASMILQGGNQVILHRLFGKGPGSLVCLRGAAARNRIRPALAGLSRVSGEVVEPNLNVLRSVLPPTAVWIIVTDLYFPERVGTALARAMVAANDGMRWVMLLELDSWPSEAALLGVGSRQVEGPGFNLPENRFEIDETALSQVTSRIQAHKAHFFSQIRASTFDLNPWSWPASPTPQAEAWFKTRFLNDPVIQRLFMREKGQ